MPLKEHLLEFRNRLMVSAGAIVVGAIVAWAFYAPIYRQLTLPFGMTMALPRDGAGAVTLT